MQVAPGAPVRRLALVATVHDADPRTRLAGYKHDQPETTASRVRRIVERVELNPRCPPAGQARRGLVDARPLAGDGIKCLALVADAKGIDAGM